jgi:hypothetical protein
MMGVFYEYMISSGCPLTKFRPIDASVTLDSPIQSSCIAWNDHLILSR